MKRLLAAWTLALCLTACVGRFSVPSRPAAEDAGRALFFQGLEELRQSDSSPALTELAGHAEAGPWQDRAAVLLAWEKRLRDQGSRGVSGLQQDLRSCRGEKEKLSQEKTALARDLQELKRIMVEMEKRRK